MERLCGVFNDIMDHFNKGEQDYSLFFVKNSVVRSSDSWELIKQSKRGQRDEDYFKILEALTVCGVLEKKEDVYAGGASKQLKYRRRGD